MNYGNIFNIGFGACLGCFLVVLILSFVDWKADKHDYKLLDKYIKEQTAMILGENRPSDMTKSRNTTSYKSSRNMEEKL